MNNESYIYVLAPAAGWFLAHVVKYLVELVKSRGRNKNDLGVFVRAGGMPSSHSAVVMAILTVIGVRQGVSSAIFGLAFVVTAIVIYDALNVRRSVGEQGDVLRKVAAQANVKGRFFTAYGHTVTEVIVGIAIGLLAAAVLLQIL